MGKGGRQSGVCCIQLDFKVTFGIVLENEDTSLRLFWERRCLHLGGKPSQYGHRRGTLRCSGGKMENAKNPGSE